MQYCETPVLFEEKDFARGWYGPCNSALYILTIVAFEPLPDLKGNSHEEPIPTGVPTRDVTRCVR